MWHDHPFEQYLILLIHEILKKILWWWMMKKSRSTSLCLCSIEEFENFYFFQNNSIVTGASFTVLNKKWWQYHQRTSVWSCENFYCHRNIGNALFRNLHPAKKIICVTLASTTVPGIQQDVSRQRQIFVTPFLQ